LFSQIWISVWGWVNSFLMISSCFSISQCCIRFCSFSVRCAYGCLRVCQSVC
jgi:hypothetical protein